MKTVNLKYKAIILFIALATVLGIFSPAVLAEENTYGAKAYEHIYHLSKELGGQRVSGSEFEKAAGKYILEQLKSFGYDAKAVDFTYPYKEGEEITSQNIVAVKPGRNKKQLIFGAHYDQVADDGSEGAQDNGSGVGSLLELAERLKDRELDYTIVFIAFGSEETGLNGSKAYVEGMTEEEIENTIGMINYDSVIAGDFIYAYSGKEGDPWLRIKALEISEESGLDLITQEGVSPNYVAGQTGNWSDHAPFNKAGIPVLYFESTNWLLEDEDGENLEGYHETEALGPIMHTENDNLDIIEENFPGRIASRLNTVVQVSEKLALEAGDVEKLSEDFDSLTTKAYIKGYPDGTFRPDGEITRGEIAAMIMRVKDLYPMDPETPAFPDGDGWFKKAVNGVAEAKIVQGYPDGTFKPEDNITRGEFIEIVSKLEEDPGEGAIPFTDVEGHWAKPAVESVYAKGYLNWLKGDTFRPDKNITRAETVMTLNAYLGQSMTEEDFKDVGEGLMTFTDVNPEHPAYFDILSASKVYEFIFPADEPKGTSADEKEETGQENPQDAEEETGNIDEDSEEKTGEKEAA